MSRTYFASGRIRLPLRLEKTAVRQSEGFKVGAGNG